MHAQVGIGTTLPDISAILHLESDNQGLLIPRLNTIQQGEIFEPASGLIIYNNDDNKFRFNAGKKTSPYWLELKIEPNPSVKYSFSDGGININADPQVVVPVIDVEEWNDDTDLYQINTTDNTITITQAGRYLITVNISLLNPGNTGNNRAPEIRLNINGEQKGAYASTAYTSGISGHDTSSLHLTEVFKIEENSFLSVVAMQSANAGVVRLRSGTTRPSNIYIEKL